MWCVPRIDQEFVDRMEDVLQLYARPNRKAEPVVCLDERRGQLLDPPRPTLVASLDTTGIIAPRSEH